MAKNPLIRSYPKRVNTPQPNKSAGILDDHAIRKNIATKEGTIEHVPTEDNHILNKKAGDDSYIKVDGTSTTTAEIPFAEGIKVSEKLTIGITTGRPTIDFADTSGQIFVDGNPRLFFVSTGTLVRESWVPETTNSYDLGTSSLKWKEVWATGKGTFGELQVDTLNLNGNVISDSTGTISFADENLTTSGQIKLSKVGANIITATNANGDLRLGAGGGTNDLKIGFNGNVDIFENLTVGGDVKTTGEINCNDKVKLTPEGGVAIRLTNRTGSGTVKGKTVKADPANDDSVILTGANDDECFGVFYETLDVGATEVWVVVGGIADVLFDPDHSPARGDWAGSGTAGFARSQASPPALGIAAHFEEIGHVIQSSSPGGEGQSALARCVLHFN